MSIKTEVARIKKNISDALAAIALRNVEVPADSTSNDLATLIHQIPVPAEGDDNYKQLVEGTAAHPVFPQNLTKIGSFLFYNYPSALALTELPETVTAIGAASFMLCSHLALTHLPAGLTSLGDSAFYGCSSITISELPSSLTVIPTSAFWGCMKMTITEIPEGIKSIANSAFAYCSGLTTITFKGTPTSISASAFEHCDNLTTINVPWAEGAVANAPWGATNATITYGVK